MHGYSDKSQHAFFINNRNEEIEIKLFQYQGQEEDHYKNILMSILEINDYSLTEKLLNHLQPNETANYKMNNLIITTRNKFCPQEPKKFEYIIGIAPYKRAISDYNKYEDNISSIPDAWICGENFNLLFEFKISGELEEAQLTAHRRLLTKMPRCSTAEMDRCYKDFE